MLDAADESGGRNNGTFVNGIRVQEQVLQDGDVIGFGKGRSVPLGQRISDKNLEVCVWLWLPLNQCLTVSRTWCAVT